LDGCSGLPAVHGLCSVLVGTSFRALQESRQNHTSAASRVAYAETRAATTIFNWTEDGPKVILAAARVHSLDQRFELPTLWLARASKGQES